MELPPAEACPLVIGNAALEPTRWPVSSSWHEGAGGYSDAQQEQERSKAPMVVYFRTDWCPYCRQLEEGLLNDATVERYFRNELVKVRINPEDGPEERAVADRYGVSGYPSVFVVGSLRGEPRRLSVRRKDQDDEAVLRTPRELIAGVEEHARRAVERLVYAGYEKREARNLEESIAVLTEALGLDPENPDAYLQRGLSHLAAGARDSAYEDFRAALALRSDYRDVFGAVGLDLWDHKLWDAGVACWTVYLGRAQSEQGYGHLWRSKMQYQRGDAAGAREDAQAACRHGESEACELVAKLGD
jgi:tetratricopeptide (TPR) repeat protein